MMDNKVMQKRQLVDEVARRSGPWGLTRRQVRDALHGILDVITDQMAEGNAVTIAGFGRFEAKEHKGRRVVGLDGRSAGLCGPCAPQAEKVCSLTVTLSRYSSSTSTPIPGALGTFIIPSASTSQEGRTTSLE